MCRILFIGCTFIIFQSCSDSDVDSNALRYDSSKTLVATNNIHYQIFVDSVFQKEKIDTTLSMNGEQVPVTVSLEEVGGDINRDTIENVITVSKERIIRILIRDQSFIVTKKLFDSIYADKRIFRRSCLGRTFIENVDSMNNRIIFSTFFGYRASDFGEVLYYAIDLSGVYQFLRAEIPEYGVD